MRNELRMLRMHHAQRTALQRAVTACASFGLRLRSVRGIPSEATKDSFRCADVALFVLAVGKTDR